MLAQMGDADTLNTKGEETLPKTGSFHRQWVRCGKPACRCLTGALHGPYHYLFWRDGGRLRKRYLRKNNVASVRTAHAMGRQNAQQGRERLRAAWETWRAAQTLLREVSTHG